MRLSLVVLISAVLSTGPVYGADPVCALLDPDKHPRVTLLEARLLTQPGATWVERTAIDKVLKEQKLQALLAPQGVGDRVRFGKLLKADLLVTVRPVTGTGATALEVIVSETVGGLRLAASAVPVTGDADADVAALLAAVRAGVVRHGEKVTQVVAVPPFVSNDLEHTHDHMRGALAKLAEAEALGRKGVVVVELAEAEALAKELALAAPGTKLERPAPVYLLGEYRHQGQGNERTIALKLRAERAGKPVGKSETFTLKRDAVAAAVRKWSAGAIDAGTDGPGRQPAAPAAEAAQLAARAKTALRLGYWEEAVALAEAALLVDPTQIDLHVFVMIALGDPLRKIHWHELSSRTDGLKAFRRFLLLYRRGLEHLEAFIDAGGDPSRHTMRGTGVDQLFLSYFRGQAYYLRTELVTMHLHAPEGPALLEEARQFERALFARLLKAPQVANASQDVHLQFVAPLLHNLSAAEQYAVVERLLAGLPDAPASAEKARWYLILGFDAFDQPEQGRPAVFRTGPAYEAFKSRVLNEKFRFAAVAKDELARAEKREADSKKYRPPAPATTSARDVRLTALKLELPVLPNRPARPLLGLVAAGPNLDVAWDGMAVYVTKEKGQFERLAPSATWPSLPESVIFDGKYVWASGMDVNPKIGVTGWFLTATDPVAGKTWNLTKTDGLPAPPALTEVQWRSERPLAIAALGPGRVCVAGAAGRAWVATLTFNPATGGTAKVLHEAREAPDRLEKDQWKKTNVKFMPGSVRVLTGASADGQPVTRIVVGRSIGDTPEISARPLIIDPDRATTEVVPDLRVPSFDPRAGNRGKGPMLNGKLFFQEPTLYGEQRLMRLTVPGPVSEVVATGLPRNVWFIHPDGQRFHVIEHVFIPPPAGAQAPARWTSNWWVVEPGATRARLAASGLPHISWVGTSAHYGLVALGESDGPDRTTNFYKVEVAAPAGK
ncbi:hypothetical protein GobsT_41290 [Gemmata obscuriglobus]|uniref:Uncharacterized protein n=1 Tax=Gemmata obscuriglobus TaxID=114 RepID=A0A2Z3GWW4_9BACT|nr:hypothetical protein [Gemmata obscuriglobus]AWM37838.1 hypothetical protein C1280_13085 [Gemmata obscuriglobus]QEG29333.1 hypothetical protein GobsT_41290 [Gemmata obscuriglobus]VTS08339.1 unnamed protein product [Gemmata obscuriglobus UQM 2246]